MSLILNQVPGVVENGRFIDIGDVIITGHGDGRVETRDINSGDSETSVIKVSGDDNVFLNIAD